MLRQIRIPVVVLAGLLLAGSAGLVGCKGGSPFGEDKRPLYERIGGHDAIVAVVNDFVGRATSDSRVNFFRKGTDREWKPSADEVATFKVHLVQFIEKAAGAPVKYEGRDMVTVHKGMKITDYEFNALAEDLAASLDHFKVKDKEKGELLAAVAATKPQIVGQ
jgi:hemoglobin